MLISARIIKTFLLAWGMTPFVFLNSVSATDFGATTNGTWNNAGIWTPGGGPPGPLDRAFIGSNTPAGSATVATVTLSANQSVDEVVLGHVAGTTGTLDIGNSMLTIADLFTIGMFGGTGSILRGSGHFTTDRLDVLQGNSLTLAAGDAVNELLVRFGATVTTATTGNVSESISVSEEGSQLNLNANINLTADLNIRGVGDTLATVDANGFDINARDIFIGRFNAAGTILNDGAITAANKISVDRSTFAFDANDDAVNLEGFDNAVITLHPTTQLEDITLRSGATTTILNTANASDTVSVGEAGSQLNLNANLNLTGNLEVRGLGDTLATVDANGFDINAQDIFIGRFNAVGTILNDGAITATNKISVDRGTFAFDANDDARILDGFDNAVITLHPTTQLEDITLRSGATTTILNTANASDTVNVGEAGSHLNLDANLNLSGNLEVRGTGDTLATVDANGFDITAQDVFVGRFNAAGAILNDGAITANRIFVDRSTFAFDANDDAVDLEGFNNAVITLLPTTELEDIRLNSGATNTILNTSNVSDTVLVGQAGSQLDVNANLNLTGEFSVFGTGDAAAIANANGADISAQSVFVGRFNGSGVLSDPGTITAANLSVERSSLTLDGGDDVLSNSLSVLTGATLTVPQETNGLTGLQLDGNALSIQDTSVLDLNFDSELRLGLDWTFRWANPPGEADRVADLEALMTSGNITVDSPHAFTIFDNMDGYTYIGYFLADFNNDGILNCFDVDALTAEILAGTNNPAFDLTFDGLVTQDDLDVWLSEAGIINLDSGQPILPGDANLDGFVDGLDFVIWNNNKFNALNAWCSADFNVDGFVDGLDFVIWNTNKFQSSDSTAHVPEPAGLWIVAVMAIGWSGYSRRTRTTSS